MYSQVKAGAKQRLRLLLTRTVQSTRWCRRGLEHIFSVVSFSWCPAELCGFHRTCSGAECPGRPGSSASWLGPLRGLGSWARSALIHMSHPQKAGVPRRESRSTQALSKAPLSCGKFPPVPLARAGHTPESAGASELSDKGHLPT